MELKRKKATLQDIADRCGVKKSTVSIILNNRVGSFPVREETIRSVKAVAKELAYVPNRFARALVTDSARYIGCSVPYVSPTGLGRENLADAIRAIDPCMMAGMVACCAEQGYDVVAVPRFESDNDVLPMRQIYPDGLDGLAWLMPSVAHREYLNVVQSGGNLILVGACPEEGVVSRCDFDNDDEAYRLTSHLIDGGARRIGYIDIYYPHYEVSRVRLEGVRRALKERGLSINEEDVFAKDEASCGVDMSKLGSVMGPGCPYEAFVISCGQYMTQIVELFRLHGINPFEDIHLGSFIEYGEPYFGHEGLSVLQTCRYDVGYRVAQMLIDRCNGSSVKHEFIKIPCQLKPRGQSEAEIVIGWN